MTIGIEPDEERALWRAGVHARLSSRFLDDVRHGLDLARLSVAGSGDRWPDALLAELRFHLAGLLNATELAIGLHLTDSQVERLIGDLGAGYCRDSIEAEPALLSPDLLAYLRRRAICAMLLRRAAAAGSTAASMAQSDDLTALAIAERRWCAPMLLDAPMRPDLPAEPYHELSWTAVALLVHGCERRMGRRDPGVTAALSRATERLIARHDEGQGAQALAQRCARGTMPEDRHALAGAALVEGRLLLFAALAERETGLPLDRIVDIMADGAPLDRHAVLRLMAVEDAIAFRTAELLAPLTGAGSDDEALARFLETYRTVDIVRARDWLVAMSAPPMLAGKLALLDPPR